MGNPNAFDNWDATYEQDPAAGDAVSQGDDWIRQLKIDLRKRAEVEQHFGSVTGDDNGLLRLGSARAFVSATAPTVLEKADYNNTTGADGTATLSANATNSSPAELLGLGRLWFNTADNSFYAYGTAGWIKVSSLPRGYIAGLKLGFTLTSVSVSVGEARVGTTADQNLQNAYLTSAFTKDFATAGGWVAGTGNAARPTGATALGAGIWYHVFLIAKLDGTTDIGGDSSLTAVNLLGGGAGQAGAAGFVRYRRLGSVMVSNAGGTVTPFTQVGETFWWNGPIGVVSTVGGDFSAADGTVTLTHTPPGLAIETMMNISIQNCANPLLIRSGFSSIGASPSVTATPLANVPIDGGTNTSNVMMRLVTDTTSRVKLRTADPSIDIYVEVMGWVDQRGRWD